MPIDVQALTGQAKDYLGSDEFKKIMPYLLSGGAGAVLGGVMTGRRRKKKGEGRLGHLRRILTNALLTGGLAAGGHALLNKGRDLTMGAIDQERKMTGGSPDESPLSTTVRNIAFSPLTAGVSGAAALGLTHGGERIGANTQGREKAMGLLKKEMKDPVRMERLKRYTAAQGGALPEHLQKLRQEAGIPSNILRGEKSVVKGWLSAATRKGPLSTFGQTNLRRSGRAGLFLAAAGVPALIGSFLSDKEKANG